MNAVKIAAIALIILAYGGFSYTRVLTVDMFYALAYLNMDI